MIKRGPVPAITIPQMAWVFEQLTLDMSLKSIALVLKVDRSTLTRRLNRAEIEGFDAFNWRQRYERN